MIIAISEKTPIVNAIKKSYQMPEAKWMDASSALYILKELRRDVCREEMRCWLDQGTLLGAVRDGKFISYDTDIDLGICYKDVGKLIQKRPHLKQNGYRVEVHCNNITFVKDSIAVNIAVYQPKGDICFHIIYIKTFKKNKHIHRASMMQALAKRLKNRIGIQF